MQPNDIIVPKSPKEIEARIRGFLNEIGKTSPATVLLSIVDQYDDYEHQKHMGTFIVDYKKYRGRIYMGVIDERFLLLLQDYLNFKKSEKKLLREVPGDGFLVVV